ncbi:MAG: N-acetylmuramoyl-L-alanine amidase [Bacteroidetes bacterium]|nr:N-acetylmuramoyl-L-alanine amidase [Bacteroidota bacterium]
MKRLVLIFGILMLLLGLLNETYAQVPNHINKVIIDAGHGGKDPGALGRYSKEKDIVLAVALKTGKYIEENMKGVEVVYTRKTDVFVELHKRAKIANESGADVFISIHCNSNKSSRPYGAETYVMGLHKSIENLEVAKTENAAIYFEEDYKTQYEGFNPESDEDYIVLNMFQNANIDQSIELSSHIQDQFRERVGRKDRGVKQAGFWVLYKTTMPGILIELGFLSHPEEEKFLMTEEGQVYMASAIYRAFRDYKNDYEARANELKPIVPKPVEEVVPVYYRVQFASYNREKELDFRKFRGLKNVKMYEHDGQYKYTVGNELTFEGAKKIKQEMIEMGFKDVFVVAFMNENRISIDEARVIADQQKITP